MKFIQIPGLDIEISLRPISKADYRLGSQDKWTGSPGSREAGAPITGISATEAREFASQMGGRLPTLDEIESLAAYVQNIPSAFACSPQGCLSEWLDCAPDWGKGSASAICIASPQWLKQKNGRSTRGSIPDRPMSFVTFRLVRG